MKNSVRMMSLFLFLAVEAAVAGNAAAAPERNAETLTLVDANGDNVVLTPNDLRGMPLVTEEELICVGKSSGYIGIFDYTGVRLSEVLQKAAATATAKEYVQENTYVVFKGTDGYQTTASWTELMVAPEGRRAMIALDKDGAPLPELEGRFRLVLPGDKYVGRSVKCLERIEIHTAEGFVDFPKKKESLEELKDVKEVPRLE